MVNIITAGITSVILLVVLELAEIFPIIAKPIITQLKIYAVGIAGVKKKWLERLNTKSVVIAVLKERDNPLAQSPRDN